MEVVKAEVKRDEKI